MGLWEDALMLVPKFIVAVYFTLPQGGDVQPVYTTDGEMLFRQEAYFHYLFGVNEDGFWGALDTRNVSHAAV
jgi:hypothetical protein